MKKILAVILLLMAPAAVFCDSIYDMVGDTLPAGKVQIEYREKFFEYNSFSINQGDTFYNKVLKIDADTLTYTTTGMYQDFVLKAGLPGGYGIAADFNYICQNLQNIYNYNNVQSVGVNFSKTWTAPLGLIVGMRFPMKITLPEDPRLILPLTSPSVVAGLFSKGSFDVLQYNAQAAFEQPLNPSEVQGILDISGSLGCNVYGNKATQSVDLALEAQYLLEQYTGYDSTGVERGYNSLAVRLVPQVRVYFYNDFYFILGVEKLFYTENTFLNNPETLIYLVKVNYMVNSDKRIVAGASGNSGAAYSPFVVTPVATATPGFGVIPQATATPVL
jgi:hypothetical protein